MAKFQNIMVMWGPRKAKNGANYFSAIAERDIKKGESIVLFGNDKGDNPKRPDYRAYESLEEEVEEEVDDIPF